MIGQKKMIERIKTNLQIRYPTSQDIEELIQYLKPKLIAVNRAVNISFEQNNNELQVTIESSGETKTLLDALDSLLIHIREKEEIQTKKHRSETD